MQRSVPDPPTACRPLRPAPLRRPCGIVRGGPFTRRPAGFARPVWIALALAACSQESAPEADGAPAVHPGVPAPLASASPQRRDTTVVRVFSDLRQDPLVRGEDVMVRARGTALILSGSVSSRPVRDRVREIAGRRLGSFSLVDSLTVVGEDG
ncbi:MAG: hypothetical protein H0V09_09145 [Gemmatimonadetes bacterium]|nr:hypothetical protein [Gemmatimonadota bacterium]